MTSLTSAPSPTPAAAPETSPAAPDSPSAQPGGIAGRLRTLKELRAQGLINEEEYQELRRKLLSEL